MITTPSLATMFDDLALMTMCAWTSTTPETLFHDYDIDLRNDVSVTSRDLEVCYVDEHRVGVRHTFRLGTAASSVDIHEIWFFVLISADGSEDSWIQRHYRIRAMEYL